MTYIAVVVAAVAAMIIGALWYSPLLFGNIWMREMGIKKKDVEAMPGMRKLYAAHLVLNIIQVALFAYAMIALGVESYNQLLSYAVFAWFTFIAIHMAGGLIWEKKSLTLYFINVLHALASIIVALLVLMPLMNMG